MMHSTFALLALYAAHAAAHGVITSVKGANGVEMPGLTVVDGTPRDCSLSTCGSQDDTAIISDFEVGTSTASALGRDANGPIDPEKNLATFMGVNSTNKKRQFLDDFLGGGDGADTGFDPSQFTGEDGGFDPSSFTGEGDGGTKTPPGTVENGVARTAGNGAESGLPTCADDGTVTLTFHQINQDGAGPVNAQVDGTSGGQDPGAFKEAEVTKDVPGLGFGGISAATNTDFQMSIKMPAGMTCEGEVAGVKNVCIARVRNDAGAGPFGGAGAFTQSANARRRALRYRLRQRRFARRAVLTEDA